MAFFHDSTFLFLLMMILQVSHCGILVRKCCDKGQVLDAETLTCISDNVVSANRMTSYIPSYVIDNQLNLMPMQLTEEHFQHDGSSLLISCSHFELLDLTKPLEYLISIDNGALVSLAGKYSADLDLGEFCIETAYLKSRLTFRAAVICNPCMKQKKCIQKCCSHLQMAVIDDKSGRIECQNLPSNASIQVPTIPSDFQKWNLVKRETSSAASCEAQNGTTVVSSDYEIAEDGSLVTSGMRLIFFS